MFTNVDVLPEQRSSAQTVSCIWQDIDIIIALLCGCQCVNTYDSFARISWPNHRNYKPLCWTRCNDPVEGHGNVLDLMRVMPCVHNVITTFDTITDTYVYRRELSRWRYCAQSRCD